MPRKGKKRRAAELREKLKTDKLRTDSERNETRDIQNEYTVTLGSLHQGDLRFEFPGVQCTFLSFYALVYMLDHPPKVWTFADIDTCVIDGNNGFVQHCNDQNMDPQMLLAKELPQMILVGDQTFECIQCDDGIRFGTLEPIAANAESGMNTLSEALFLACSKFDSCLLFCGGMTVALAHSESIYYVFDPHSRGKDGLLHPQGSAVLVHFPCIRKTILFLQKLFSQSLRLQSTEQFELVPLIISRVKPRTPVANFTSHDKGNIVANESLEKKIHEVSSETPNKSEVVDTAQKNAKELSEEAVKTYFEDQLKRDKAHKKRNDLSRPKRDQAKRNEYMRNYMHSIRKTQSTKSKQKAITRKRIKYLLSTEEARMKHREQSAKGMKKIRSTPDGKAKSRESQCKSMRRLRDTTEGQMKNREAAATSMKRKRSTSEGQSKNREAGCKSMKRIRDTPEGRLKNRETSAIAMKRKRSTSKGQAENRESAKKIMKRLRNTSEGIQRKKRKRTVVFEDTVKKFNETISGSCSYVCSCCQQLWFKHSVKDVSNLTSSVNLHLLKRCLTGYKSDDGIEWICSTCLCNIRNQKIPKLSVVNGMKFPDKPPELFLNNLEERLISLRIPFMQIRALSSGGQLSLKGSVVNVPADIEPTLRALPRMKHESQTVPVKLKRIKDYKHAVQTENVRPAVVMKALQSLLNTSEMYKQANLKIDNDWNEHRADDELINPCLNYSDDESDHFSEVDESDKMPVMTFLDERTHDRNEVVSVAPGEGQRPLSLFKDPNSEYLAFPTIFCGAKRIENIEREVPVYYSDICKWELRSVDRRVALNVPNIFYKMKKLQTEQVCSKAHLAVRRCKTKGKHYSAGFILKDNMGESLVRLDEGFRIFRTIRNSPTYWENQKKEVFAMIRQLGIPTLFMSFSANDLNWSDLIVTLGKLVDNKDYSDEVKNNSLSWETRSRLVQADPITCVRHFDNRVSQFIQTVLKSDSCPLGLLSDFFYRVEFQQRGSPHIHMLAWIQDAPKYGVSDELDVLRYVDSVMSCSGDVPQTHNQYLDLQRHKHSRSCRKGGKAECRFGIPFPPMRESCIVHPFTGDNRSESEEHYRIIQKALKDLEEDIPFDVFLSTIGLDEADYMKAVQTSIKSEKIFLKRRPIENRINPYIKDMLDVWKANHDIQFVLDAYACAMYIVSYINKSSKGMSSLMAEACKEAKKGSKSLNESVRHIGNKFLNAVEVSAQEAAYLVLQLNMSLKSRSCEFLPTAPLSERTFLLKSRKELEALPDESTDIEANNVVKRYSQRHPSLENFCLADYVSKVVSVSPVTKDVSQIGEDKCKSSSDNDDNRPDLDKTSHRLDTEIKRYSLIKGNTRILLRSNPKIIRYVKYNKDVDPEQFFREQLMLFYPWRNEQTDLLNGFDTYEKSFNAVSQTLDLTKREYDRNTELLDKVESATTALILDNFDSVSPNIESREAKDAEIEPIASSEHAFYRPQTDEQTNYDLGGDLGITAHIANDDVEMVQNVLPENDYLELLAKLNLKQRQIFTHIIQSLIFEPDKRLHLFITGGAGVGKSLVINTLYQTLHRLLCSDSGQNPEDVRILLCAYTGLAAYNIKGTTLHSAFNIEPNKKLKFKPLSDDKRNTLQTKYRHLSILIIDEVSMVGNEMLNFLFCRLQEIKGNKEPFGGVHILLVGDLFQLRPVGDGWIFANASSDYSILAPNLWRKYFKMFELNEIMRQKDDKEFAQLLNRIREGNHTENDIASLQARSVSIEDPHYQALKHELHLFPCNMAVDTHNESMFERAVTEKVEIGCLDSVLGEETTEVKQKILNQLKGRKTSDTGNLSETLKIAVGLQYDTTHNVSVEDGICNGTPCVLRMIHYMETQKCVPSCLWVEFPDPSIGRNTRREYSHYYKRYPGVSKMWTPIWCVRRTFMFRKKAIVRQQFPLKSSSAKTIHKAQGQTKSCVVVDTTGSRSHQHYVAFSRVTQLQGLHLLHGLNGSIKVDSAVTKEMRRLREESCIDLSYKPVSSCANELVVVFQNAQSLHRHFPQIKSDETFTNADILCLAETRLVLDDDDFEYAIDGFQPIIRNDQATNGQRPPHGLAVYIRNFLRVESFKFSSSSKIESITLEVIDSRRGVSYTVMTVYKSPSCSFNDFQTCMRTVKVPSTHQLMIIGDFNFDISSNRSDRFMSSMKILFPNAKLQNTLPTTHGNTILDLCFTTSNHASAYVVACVWSYHHTLVCSFS